MSWPFFATLTVTAYMFSIVSSILGVFCRLNFGKGLAHYREDFFFLGYIRTVNDDAF